MRQLSSKVQAGPYTQSRLWVPNYSRIFRASLVGSPLAVREYIWMDIIVKNARGLRRRFRAAAGGRVGWGTH